MDDSLYNPSPIHRQIRDMTERFGCDVLKRDALRHDREERFAAETFRRVGTELQLFGVTLPEEYGGHGLDATASVIIHEEMSRFDPAFTLSYLAHEILFIHNLSHSGSPEQKRRYLPPAVSGEKICGMAMTEPGAGTDVLNMKAHFSEKGDRFILNGVKQFITNAPQGDTFLVYAKRDLHKRDITAFIVEKDFSGFSVGKRERKMGMRASPTAQLIFEDMDIPKENLVGEVDKGLVHMMRNLEIERITLAAQAIGIARRCVEIMTTYAMRREAFGKPILSLGQIESIIGESYARLAAARSLVYTTARRISPQCRCSLEAAAAKWMATTSAEIIARNAVQVLGGYGYCEEYEAERFLRDAVLLSIGGGTNEAMKKNIVSDLKRMDPLTV